MICTANGSRALVGKAARFSIEGGPEYTFGAFMGCFRPDVGRIHPAFSAYLFQTDTYRNQVELAVSGSTINNLKPDNIRNMSFRVPTKKDEQRAIAAVLSDMDAEIEALEEKLSKARQIKQGMMH